MPSVEIEIDMPMSDEELGQRIQILGELIVNRIKQNIRDMNLIRTGDLLQKWFTSYSNGVLTIESGTKYGQYLEYGTYAYFDQYGFDDYPEFTTEKKMYLSAEAKKMFPKGTQPFAFVRKVIYNENVMAELAEEAFS